MLSEDTRSFLDFLTMPQSDHRRQAAVQRFCRDMLDQPEEAKALLGVVAAIGNNEQERPEIGLLSAILDEARMARENRQRRGEDMILALETEVARINRSGTLTLSGSFALGQVWFQASLPAPAGLVLRDAQLLEATSHAAQAMDTGDAEAISSLFDALFGDLVKDSDGSLTALHGALCACLPVLPEDSRQALARVAVGQKGPIFADLGATWLLDPSALLRKAALLGLRDRQCAGQLSRETLARLTVIRSWIQDDETHAGLDTIIREGMRQDGDQAGPAKTTPKLHRVLTSMIDGSGAQSITVAVQGSAGRMVAVVLLKEGYGVKDAYVIPCQSASEQKRLITEIAGRIDGMDVPVSYLVEALPLAMAEGAACGHTPAPGLIEVAMVCGLTDLRPTSGELTDIIHTLDPLGRVAALSVQARGRLIMASEHWEDDYPILTSWFEDSDEIFGALDTLRTSAAAKKQLWAFLESRRAHWARLIARMGLLIAAGGDIADEFTATALALAEGRDLKKIPIMEVVFDQTLHVWSERHDTSALSMQAAMQGPSVARSAPSPEKPGELARLLRKSSISPVWLDGYLLACCIAPDPVMPGEWIEPLYNIVGPSLGERGVVRFLDIVMLRYNATLRALQDSRNMVPGDQGELPDWADGVLTAWEAMKVHWPARALGKEGKTMRILFEGLADGTITNTVTGGALEKWIRTMSRVASATWQA